MRTTKAKLFHEATFFILLNGLIPCLNAMELAFQVLLGHFGPVYLLQVIKNDEKELKLIWL